MVSEEFMDEIIESEIEQMDKSCEQRISGAQEIISSQCDVIEQLKAELEKVQQDKASNDSDYLKLSAENNDLKRELADKNKYGCCIVEHGYRMESEQCLKDITKQLENSRAEITALKSKLKIAVEALEYVAAEGDRSGSRFRSERQHDLAIAGQALTEIGGEI